ncbi:MAG TPA: bifunctional ornithine acetyltransferase/N-acetylglutamate synthase, partial [Solirubrobacteraceae bacterium]|nr:bifunctional ornithine acetyltransferase/N-acetylglutamate synthase [Solirubrobacteraceae bacterium]
MTATGFFHSRWIDAPGHVSEDPGGGLPLGFRAGAIAAGLRPDGRIDLGLLVCDAEDVVSAARFTRSGVLAAPVQLCRQRCRLDGLRAVVANSGNANAATGRQGLDEAARCQGAAAMAVGVDAERVAIASTGVIGVPL